VVVIVIAVAGLLTLRFMVADDGYPAILSLRADMAEVHGDLRRLHAENTALERRIAALRDDTYPVEKLAREELDFALPGEIIYLFPQDLEPFQRSQAHGESAAETQP
jgi:cell division protein FtsB